VIPAKSILASVCACAFGLGGCTNFANKVHQFSTGYQSFVADITQILPRPRPDVAVACAHLQTAGMLVAPFVPANTSAGDACRRQPGISTYCQAIQPTSRRCWRSHGRGEGRAGRL